MQGWTSDDDMFHRDEKKGQFVHHSSIVQRKGSIFAGRGTSGGRMNKGEVSHDNQAESPSASRRSVKVKKLRQLSGPRGRHVVVKVFPCKICLRPFTNGTSAHLHVHTHLNPHELEQSSLFHERCPHCERVFFDRGHFTNHVNAHEGRKNYACLTCKQKFTQKAHMTTHLFVHLSREERAAVRQRWRHGCYFCSKLFQRQSRLAGHLVTHTKEKVSWGVTCVEKVSPPNKSCPTISSPTSPKTRRSPS
ncbi:PR domain zinc finger protein 4 [Folsomia candida]|uniref:PR domain zinc finger protein 4 n=1 Tax=Folsomia candida TaxID=158441 RepID=A0A226DJN9_FOLCA|nr:PR domain zinc finger protein 4 [Folsomia candida]